MSDPTDNRFYREKQEQPASKDLVSELRVHDHLGPFRMSGVMREAADEIERLQKENADLAHTKSALQGMLDAAEQHVRVLRDQVAAHEPPAECPDCEKALEERDYAQDKLQETHIALGGDGEWSGRMPPQEPPDSGDLHLDVPALAAERMAELEQLRAAQPPLPVRQLFNKATGVQKGNRLSFSFETEEEAIRAFHYIATLGELEASRPSPTKGAGDAA